VYRSLAFLMLITAAVSEKTFALQPAVPVHQEPRHRLVLERDRSRVLDVLIVPGDTTLYHIHAQPIFYISLGLGPAKSKSTGKTGPIRKPGARAMWPATLLTPKNPGPTGSQTQERNHPGSLESRTKGLDRMQAPMKLSDWRTNPRLRIGGFDPIDLHWIQGNQPGNIATAPPCLSSRSPRVATRSSSKGKPQH
jgi:hypothetical protein